MAAELDHAAATLLTHGNAHQADLEERRQGLAVSQDYITGHLANVHSWLMVRACPLSAGHQRVFPNSVQSAIGHPGVFWVLWVGGQACEWSSPFFSEVLTCMASRLI